MHGEDEIEEIPEQLKKELIEKLDQIEQKANSRKEQLVREGIKALTPAANNENQAMDLYEKCLKKVEYTDLKKPEKEWREWKNKSKEMLGNPVYKKMVMYQCKWALVSLKAGMEPEETFIPGKYLPQALDLIREIYADEKMVVEGRGYTFRQAVFDGPIGKVFQLDGCIPKEWPSNILSNREIFERLALAPCRKKKDIDGLRKAWNSYMQIEKTKNDILEKNNKKENNYNSMGGDSNAIVIQQKYETMAWMREMDCYMAGGRETAVKNMMNIIQQTTDPTDIRSYIQGMKALLEDESDKKHQIYFSSGNGVAIYPSAK